MGNFQGLESHLKRLLSFETSDRRASDIHTHRTRKKYTRKVIGHTVEKKEEPRSRKS